MSEGLLLVDHGSRVTDANKVVGQIAEMLGQQEPKRLVAAAHMELAEPSIAQAIASLVAKGCNHLVVVPFMLAPGRHATEDIPRLVAEVARLHNLTYRVTAPLGADPLLAELVRKRAREDP